MVKDAGKMDTILEKVATNAYLSLMLLSPTQAQRGLPPSQSLAMFWQSILAGSEVDSDCLELNILLLHDSIPNCDTVADRVLIAESIGKL